MTSPPHSPALPAMGANRLGSPKRLSSSGRPHSLSLSLAHSPAVSGGRRYSSIKPGTAMLPPMGSDVSLGLFHRPRPPRSYHQPRTVTAHVSQELNASSVHHLRRLLRQCLDRFDIEHPGQWEPILAQLLLKMTTQVETDVRAGDRLDVRPYVKVKKISGGVPQDSQFVAGVVCTKNLAHRKMPQVIRKPRIMILAFPLEYERDVNQFLSIDVVMAQERAYLDMLVNRVLMYLPTLILVEKSVSSMAQSILWEKRIAFASHVKRSVLDLLARLTGADVITSIDELSRDPQLGYCGEMAIQSFQHQYIPGIRKSYMYFHHCPRPLGCTLTLRGTSQHQLVRLKEIMRFMVMVAYNLKLETWLVRDLFALAPTVSTPPTTTASGTSLLSTPTALLPSTETLAAGSNADQPSTGGPDTGHEAEVALVPYKQTILSMSPGVTFPPPYLLVQMEEVEDHYYRIRDEYHQFLRERTQQPHLSIPSSLLTGSTPAPTLSSQEEWSDDLRLFHQYENILNEYGSYIRAGESFIQQHSTNMVDPLYHQNLYIFSTIQRLTDLQACHPPEISLVEYYLDSDITLGQYLEEMCFNAASRCPAPPAQCDLPMTQHARQYIHGSGNVTVTVEDCPPPYSGMDQTLLIWSQCRICHQATPVVPMSEESWKISFGKFLELLFYGKNMYCRADLCPHTINHHHTISFGLHHLAARFVYTPINLSEVAIPALKLSINSQINAAIKRRDVESLQSSIQQFWDSVVERIQNFDAWDLVAPDRVSHGRADLAELLKIAESERVYVLQYLAQVNQNTHAADTLSLNAVRTVVQEKVYDWDARFDQFVREYILTERDLRKNAGRRLRHMILGQLGGSNATATATATVGLSEPSSAKPDASHPSLLLDPAEPGLLDLVPPTGDGAGGLGTVGGDVGGGTMSIMGESKQDKLRDHRLHSLAMPHLPELGESEDEGTSHPDVLAYLASLGPQAVADVNWTLYPVNMDRALYRRLSQQAMREEFEESAKATSTTNSSLASQTSLHSYPPSMVVPLDQSTDPLWLDEHAIETPAEWDLGPSGTDGDLVPTAASASTAPRLHRPDQDGSGKDGLYMKSLETTMPPPWGSGQRTRGSGDQSKVASPVPLTTTDDDDNDRRVPIDVGEVALIDHQTASRRSSSASTKASRARRTTGIMGNGRTAELGGDSSRSRSRAGNSRAIPLDTRMGSAQPSFRFDQSPTQSMDGGSRPISPHLGRAMVKPERRPSKRVGYDELPSPYSAPAAAAGAMGGGRAKSRGTSRARPSPKLNPQLDVAEAIKQRRNSAYQSGKPTVIASATGSALPIRSTADPTQGAGGARYAYRGRPKPTGTRFIGAPSADARWRVSVSRMAHRLQASLGRSPEGKQRLSRLFHTTSKLMGKQPASRTRLDLYPTAREAVWDDDDDDEEVSNADEVPTESGGRGRPHGRGYKQQRDDGTRSVRAASSPYTPGYNSLDDEEVGTVVGSLPSQFQRPTRSQSHRTAPRDISSKRRLGDRGSERLMPAPPIRPELAASSSAKLRPGARASLGPGGRLKSPSSTAVGRAQGATGGEGYSKRAMKLPEGPEPTSIARPHSPFKSGARRTRLTKLKDSVRQRLPRVVRAEADQTPTLGAIAAHGKMRIPMSASMRAQAAIDSQSGEEDGDADQEEVGSDDHSNSDNDGSLLSFGDGPDAEEEQLLAVLLGADLFSHSRSPYYMHQPPPYYLGGSLTIKPDSAQHSEQSLPPEGLARRRSRPKGASAARTADALQAPTRLSYITPDLQWDPHFQFPELAGDDGMTLTDGQELPSYSGADHAGAAAHKSHHAQGKDQPGLYDTTTDGDDAAMLSPFGQSPTTALTTPQEPVLPAASTEYTTSIIRALSSYLIPALSGVFTPLVYPLPPTAHVLPDSAVVVREDEPSSIIAYTLSSRDFRLQFQAVADAGVISQDKAAAAVGTTGASYPDAHMPLGSSLSKASTFVMPTSVTGNETHGEKLAELDHHPATASTASMPVPLHALETTALRGSMAMTNPSEPNSAPKPPGLLLAEASLGPGSKPTSNTSTAPTSPTPNHDPHPTLTMQGLEQVLRSSTSNHARYEFSHGPASFVCKIFFAEQFDALRRSCDCESVFVESLSRCAQWNASGGKSGSAFLKTEDNRFIIKQLSKPEMDAFLKFAPHYFEYLAEAIFHELPTLLAKIYGLYRISFKNPVTGKVLKLDVMIMENLFYERNVTKTFDLKGSMRNRLVQDTGRAGEVLLDENLVKHILQSPLYIRDHAKDLIRSSIWNDTLFLAKHEVVDYSLLVAIDEEKHELVIGIVDFIRTFTWDKRLENWVKEAPFLGGGGKQPTIVSPKQYKNRFRSAMERYFTVVPDKFFRTANSDADDHPDTSYPPPP
ncbi:Mitochondrial distribution and morphology protein 12 [Dimargaris xerosporica]|nr:Mitochondrial distribution and morphology protein 12 [Dimargaris xerosporica]